MPLFKYFILVDVLNHFENFPYYVIVYPEKNIVNSEVSEVSLYIPVMDSGRILVW